MMKLNALEGEVSVSLAANNSNLTSLCLLGVLTTDFEAKLLLTFS